MKAVLVERVGDFVIRDMEVPQPAKDEVLLKVSVTGLCRTDLKLIRVGHRDLVLPRIPGEEVVGTIVDIGGDVKGYEPGERVYVYPGKWCGLCENCLKGAENLCASMEIMGFHRHGGFAEYVTAPAKSLIKIPDTISDEEAVFAEPLSCCLNALELARLAPKETIAIWGAGPAGTLLSRASRAGGAVPTVIDPHEGRAAAIGGTTTPPKGLFDVAIVAVGADAAYREALTHLRPRGRLIVFSGLAPTSAVIDTDFNMLHYLEQTITGAYGCGYRHGEQALSLMATGAVTVGDLISHRMDLSELGRALEMVEQRTAMKIHLYP